MLVKEIIDGINAQTITRTRICEQYGITTRTFSNKIKALGYSWDKAAAKYSYQGNQDIKVIEATEWESLFNQPRARRKPTEAPQQPAATTARKVSKKTETPAEAPKQPDKAMDIIDALFSHVEPEKEYRGFYIDKDILAAVDKVKGRNKSKLVNECLRIVLESKGLL